MSDEVKIEEIQQDNEEVNAFGFPYKSYVKTIQGGLLPAITVVAEKPDCNDKNLIEKAQKAVAPFIKLKSDTILNRRKNILITKNVDNFVDFELSTVNLAENKIVAARFVELKINKGLKDDNFKVCRTNNRILGEELFIFMYDDGGNVKAEILNIAGEVLPVFYVYDK